MPDKKELTFKDIHIKSNEPGLGLRHFASNGRMLLLFILMTALNGGCGEVRNIFREESPRDKYEAIINKAGLMETSLGRQWKLMGDSTLKIPVEIPVPYREEGYFPHERAEAVTFTFMGKKGEKIRIKTSSDTLNKMQIFTDLFINNVSQDGRPERVAFAPGSPGIIEYEVEENRNYLLRLQPELLRSGKYTLTIESGPSLAFPVAGKNSKAIASFFGDKRDGGARKHEGVDIFAPRRTPVLASASGIITSTGISGMGGKTVWLSTGLNQRLYYAHLDTQFVRPGRRVKAGDTLGLVGNTGNARFTAPHLHFGIYLSGEGAVNPYPYIADITILAKPVTADTFLVGFTGRTRVKNSEIAASPFPNGKTVATLNRNSVFRIEAAAFNLFRIKLPDGQRGYIKASSAEGTSLPVKTAYLKSPVPLLDYPGIEAQVIDTLSGSENIRLMGEYNGYYLARMGKYSGWVKKNDI